MRRNGGVLGGPGGTEQDGVSRPDGFPRLVPHELAVRLPCVDAVKLLSYLDLDAALFLEPRNNSLALLHNLATDAVARQRENARGRFVRIDPGMGLLVGTLE